MKFKHTPVLLNETIEGLNIKEDGIYVDGTLGGAGHSIKILEKLSTNGKLIGIDRDEEALVSAKEKLKNYNNVIYVHGNHDDIDNILQQFGIEQVDGILLDLGVSSYQIDSKDRGFSYMYDTQLDMRMDKKQKLSAKDIVNKYSEKDLADIIYEYGEERFSRQIAKKIVECREKKEIQTTGELVEIIKKAIPLHTQNYELHPEKRTFQAIRIEVNNEIKPLYETILKSIKSLKTKGRLCVITFHSLEDRAVKNAFIHANGKCICPTDLPYCVCNPEKLGNIITRKPIIPTQKEQDENSRSKSAKLRIFEKN